MKRYLLCVVVLLALLASSAHAQIYVNGGWQAAPLSPTQGGTGGTGPLDFWSYGSCPSVGAQTATSNTLAADGFSLPFTVTAGHLAYYVQNTDATGLYDIGLYGSNGSLVADIGPVHLPSSGFQTAALKQGTVTFAPGDYLVAVTGNATTGAFAYCSGEQDWYSNNSFSSSSGGQLPTSITFPTSQAIAQYVLYFSLLR